MGRDKGLLVQVVKGLLSCMCPPGELCSAASGASEISSGVGTPDCDSQAWKYLPLHGRCLPPPPHSCGSRKLFPD